ncbi:histidine phosphatase family protein [Streptomyces sp. ISL-66]|uniref:SixA phosphatase family protein n=1 Tax=Streptomyces sp. ISL-66 TaxID=2819186 RepID=UPI001BE898B4|nr:histidine phosphatase family protein [Streptomyces sp. ISL-66]MBT2467741.1 histidine phosphatase family protein [Streptomyces sp. ISL-66]
MVTATPGERRIVLVRHAKSVPKDAAATDFERPLADRGRQEAPQTGQWLEDSGRCLDLALCSSALRTRQTWQLMEARLTGPPPVVYEDRLYNAERDALLAVLAETSEAVGDLLLVGHNPGIHEVAVALCGTGPKRLLGRIRDGFPTSAVVVIELAGNWREVEPGAGRLMVFWAPGD